MDLEHTILVFEQTLLRKKEAYQLSLPNSYDRCHTTLKMSYSESKAEYT